MFGVSANAGLEHYLFFFSGESAAINEGPHQMPNLCDVGVGRNVVPFRQDKPWIGIWILFQRESQGPQIHNSQGIYRYKHIVNRPPF